MMAADQRLVRRVGSTLPPPPRDDADSTVRDRNVVVVVDGSPKSDGAIKEALALTHFARSKITLIFVLPSPWIAGAATAHICIGTDLRGAFEEEARAYLTRAAREFSEESSVVGVAVERRAAVRWLSQNSDACDLVILGTSRSLSRCLRKFGVSV